MPAVGTPVRTRRGCGARPLEMSFGIDGLLRDANDQFLAITGLTRGSLNGISVFDLAHPWDIPITLESLSTLTESLADSAAWECRIADADGGFHTISWIGSIGVDGAIRARGRDITDERSSERGLDDSGAWLRESLIIANAAAWRYSVSTDRVYSDPTFDRLLGVNATDRVTTWQDLSKHIYVHDREHFVDAREQLRHSGELSADYRLARHHDGIGHVAVRLRTLDRQAHGLLAVGAAWDITATKAMEARLYDAAMHDQLTGLANRRAFEIAVRGEWARGHRNNTPTAFVMVDVDDFKTINDEFGHERGDTALVNLAEIIRGCIGRAGDLVARYGGEEVVVLLPDTDSKGALAVATRIVTRCREQTTSPRFTVSAGSASSRVTDDSPWAILRRADQACLEAKRWGKDHAQPAETE